MCGAICLIQRSSRESKQASKQMIFHHGDNASTARWCRCASSRLGCPYPSCDRFPCFCVAVGPRPGSAGPPTTVSQPVPLSPLRGGRRPDLGTPKVGCIALKDFKPKRVRRILSLRRIEEYQQLECSHAILHVVPDGIGSRLRIVYVTYSWS